MRRCVTMLGLGLFTNILCGQMVFIKNQGQLKDVVGHNHPEILCYTVAGYQNLFLFENGYALVSRKGNTVTRRDTFFSGFRIEKTQADEYCNFYCYQGTEQLKVATFNEVSYWNERSGERISFEMNKQGCIVPSKARQTPAASAASCFPWSTYFGGNTSDQCWGITLDKNKNSYVSGYTLSNDLPATAGSFQDTSGGNYDAFVAKFDSCGNRKWATYIGGTANDFGQKIAVCGQNVVLCGYTSGNDFPASANAWQPASNGSYDSFLFMLDSSGARVWSTYFGGSGGELGLALACDADKNIFLGGSTSSTDLPVQNAFQSAPGGALDAFVAKFDSAGLRKWCTYYGGSGSEDVHSMSTDYQSNIVITGGTFSSDLNISAGAFQSVNKGAPDGYVVKFDSAGNRVFSTYFGGAAEEDATGVCTDASGNIYICGYSDGVDLPVTAGAFQLNNQGKHDAYIAKFDPTGQITWCTYFGGSGNEDGYAISSDHGGHLFILSSSDSTDTPIIGTPVQNNNAGKADIFIGKFSESGVPLWSTFFGGSNDDIGYDLSVTADMKVFCAGYTTSFDFPVSAGAFQGLNNGPEDAFLCTFDGSFDITLGGDDGSQSVFSLSPNPSMGQFTVTWDQKADEVTHVVMLDLLGNTVFSSSTKSHSLNCTVSLPEGIYLLTLTNGTQIRSRRIVIR